MAYCSPAKPRSGYIAARDQSMVESSVTEAGKTLPVFTFCDEHSKIHNTNTKPKKKLRKQRFSKLSLKRNSSQWRKRMQILHGKYFVNHSFSDSVVFFDKTYSCLHRMTATVYFANRQSNYQYFLLFITCTCRLCKLSRCNFYGTFAFKRAIAHMRYVVK